MAKIAFFGGTGGLGSKVIEHLGTHTIKPVGSRLVNLQEESEIQNYFSNNKDLDVLVIFSNYNFNAFLHKYKENQKELNKQIAINIEGVTTCIANVLPNMRERNFGRIILASSITVDRNVIGTSLYAASKAYYENLVQTICIENAQKGITANCIQLGYMDGGLTYTLDEEFLKSTIKSIPTKRLGTSEEIAMTIEFLINNPYVNGTTIKLTGGL
jgi:NAD(P)-dependent dehydrogenase (short-subunit alcohol dehydrogenase family)